MKDKNELRLSEDMIARLKAMSHGEKIKAPEKGFARRTLAALERRKLVRSYKDGSYAILAAGRKAVA